MKWCFFLLGLFLSNLALGQDTLSVFFESGSHEIISKQKTSIHNIQYLYEFDDVDSIHFIGMTDSVGNVKSNIRLSKRRVSNVYSLYVEFLPENISYKTFALGEIMGNNDKGRRVDVIFYFKTKKTVNEFIANDSVSNQLLCGTSLLKCMKIDYDFLNKCHITSRRIKNINYVLIEAAYNDIVNKKEHYYIDNTFDFSPRKVKWKTKTNGDLWWKEKRYVALIPEENFKENKIFKYTNVPCNTCYEKSALEPFSRLEIDSCLSVDKFLMQNIRFKHKFFNKSILKIQAPQEYVDTSLHYYYSNKIKNEIKWSTKGRKHKSVYLFTEISLDSLSYFPFIQRNMACCPSAVEIERVKHKCIKCAGVIFKKNRLNFRAETGGYLKNNNFVSYVGLGLNRNSIKYEFSILAGIDNNIDFYSSVKLDYNIFPFSLKGVSSFSGWSKSIKNFDVKKYGILYLGTELNSVLFSDMKNFVDHNIHVGLSYNNLDKNSILPKVFIHFGYAKDYFSETKQIVPILKFGVTFQIKRIN